METKYGAYGNNNRVVLFDSYNDALEWAKNGTEKHGYKTYIFEILNTVERQAPPAVVVSGYKG